MSRHQSYQSNDIEMQQLDQEQSVPFLTKSTSIKTRHTFIIKVYTIVFIQLLASFGFVIAATVNDNIRNFVQSNGYMLWVSFGICIGTLIVMTCCCYKIVKHYPIYGYLLLFIFTIAQSYMLGMLASFYETDSVLISMIMTLTVTLALTLFAIQTKYDFTGMGGYLIAILVPLILFGIISAILCGGYTCRILNIIYSSIATIVFSLYIVYDTQLIIGGGHKYQFDESDYILAALSLYLDIINLFINLLELVGSRREN